MKWIANRVGTTVNVMPLHDKGEHEQLSTCPCAPRVEIVKGGMVIVHNSYDGREAVEKARKILEECARAPQNT